MVERGKVAKDLIREEIQDFKSGIDRGERTLEDYITLNSVIETLEYNLGFIISTEYRFGTVGLEGYQIENIKDSYKITKACITVVQYYCTGSELKNFKGVLEFFDEAKSYVKDVKKLQKGGE